MKLLNMKLRKCVIGQKISFQVLHHVLIILYDIKLFDIDQVTFNADCFLCHLVVDRANYLKI